MMDPRQHQTSLMEVFSHFHPLIFKKNLSIYGFFLQKFKKYTFYLLYNINDLKQTNKQTNKTKQKKPLFSSSVKALHLNSCSLPITLIANRHTASFPDASWAVHCTILRPMWNWDTASWSQVIVGIPPELSVAVGLLQSAVAVDSPLWTDSVWLEGQSFSTGATPSEKKMKNLLTPWYIKIICNTQMLHVYFVLFADVVYLSNHWLLVQFLAHTHVPNLSS